MASAGRTTATTWPIRVSVIIVMSFLLLDPWTFLGLGGRLGYSSWWVRRSLLGGEEKTPMVDR